MTIIATNGIITNLIFPEYEFSTNLIVVSEKIIKNTPIKNVISFNFEYLEFSFDKKNKIRGVSERIRI